MALTTQQAFRAVFGAARAALNRGEVDAHGHLQGALEFDDDATALVAQWTGLPTLAPWRLSAYTVARAARRVAEDLHAGRGG